MTGELKVSFVQVSLNWEDVNANLNMLTKMISTIDFDTDLIVLPEMFSTGFTMKPKNLAEDMAGLSVEWLRETAKSKNCVVTGSLVFKEKGGYYNRLFWMRPNGTFETYDKRHLFSLVGEEKHYEQGRKRLIVDLKGFKIMPLICYDLRFPVWSRNDVGYDLALYVANWPERRSFFWKQLLVARAIENQAYVIGVNRVGFDGHNIYHSGDSMCLGPLGNVVSAAEVGKEEIVNVIIKKSELETVRNKFKFLDDQDEFEVIT